MVSITIVFGFDIVCFYSFFIYLSVNIPSNISPVSMNFLGFFLVFSFC